MKINVSMVAGVFIILLLLTFESCLKREKQQIKPLLSDADTTTFIVKKYGLIKDTKTLKGISNVYISFLTKASDLKDSLIFMTTTDSLGNYAASFRILKTMPIASYYIKHDSSIYFTTTHDTRNYIDKINDSTELLYLHRKSTTAITLINNTNSKANVMLFNKTKELSKLFLNLNLDTTIYFVMPTYNEEFYFDFFPQKKLVQKSVRGSTSGDTFNVEFNYN